jgi:hypothetical protein
MAREAVKVIVKDAPKLTKKGRRKLAAWLRAQARFVETRGEELAPTFTARFFWL